ncbi:MAG: citramalate synthase [Clostridiales bacterium]|jgi:2-isopropylmalate synthase|nr:citramalate synthase [Clostridiales bacterium]HOK82325.1 citramalate synthase [Clostridia bacterium]HOL61137.1 citramalate synthase [Clostridia bacterium]HPO53729.1 citramalate synthase [Clostridia bacterium]
MKKIEIFDSSLRDGAQSEGISFSVQDKLNIVKALDDFGVAYIEAGNPGSNPKDIEFFEKARGLKLKHAKLCAFGSTRRKNLKVEDDPQVKSLLNAGTQTVVIFGKSWDLHIKEILGITKEENLSLVYDTVSYLKANGKEVIFDAEHFFDGYKADPECALSVLDAAERGGADVLTLCDTNGGTLPSEIYEITTVVAKKHPSTRISIHCHNDTGCAVANSMMAVAAGATQVQGTFIGIGERCGNADLSIIIPNLQLKMGYKAVEGDLAGLCGTSYRIYEISNLIAPTNKPYTGTSAFAHKGGMHIDGVDKCRNSFEHVPPESVGNSRRYLMSEMSGRTTVIAKIANLAPELNKNSPETKIILDRIKELEHEGYQFESADASFELIVLNILGRFRPHFKLQMYKTSGEYPPPDGEQSAYALVKLAVDGKTETAASIGNGPVNALDLALRRALSTFYPCLHEVHLTDYKVRVLSGDQATGAKVRVLIENTDGKRVWTTVGVSTDIIEASRQALVDSLEYYLYLREVN